MFARMAILLGSGVDNKVAGKPGADEEDGVGGCDVAVKTRARLGWEDKLETAARDDDEPVDFNCRVNCMN
jgi:hypothetical protein